MAAVLSGSPARRETIWQRLRALSLRAAVSNPLSHPPLALAAAWAPSTAYLAGNVVSNGGNLYECHTAGTSAALGGPGETGAGQIADGTAAWVYAGVHPVAMASPLVPTITHFNGDSPAGLEKRYTIGANVFPPNDVALTGSMVRVVGGAVRVEDSTIWRFPSLTTFNNQSGNIENGTASTPGLAGMLAGIEFRTDAPRVAFLWSFGQLFRLFVDGVRVWPGVQRGGAGGGVQGPCIDYTAAGGRNDRLWRIEFKGNVQFLGICVDLGSSISYPHATDAIRFIALGDSHTGIANGFPIFPGDGWVDQLGKRMGWADCRPSGAGGTGYTTGGPSNLPKPMERLGDLIGHAPDVAGFAFGSNDGGAGPAATTAAALACFQAARAALPGVPLFVWGVPASVNKSLAAAISTENAVFAAVTQANDNLLIPVPVSTDADPWFTGTGFVSAPTGSGNNDFYVSSDEVHGTNSWHAHWAARSATELRRIIAARA